MWCPSARCARGGGRIQCTMTMLWGAQRSTSTRFSGRTTGLLLVGYLWACSLLTPASTRKLTLPPVASMAGVHFPPTQPHTWGVHCAAHSIVISDEKECMWNMTCDTALPQGALFLFKKKEKKKKKRSGISWFKIFFQKEFLYFSLNWVTPSGLWSVFVLTSFLKQE